jgi:hypothetical protein
LIEAVAERLDEAATVVAGVDLDGSQANAIKSELQAAIRLARHGAWRIARLTESSGHDDNTMHADLAEAIDLQRSAWLGRSRPGGMQHSLGLLEAVLQTYSKT